jgi:hypothetical protein
MLKPASFHGHLASGPPRGQSVTFVRPDRWLGGWREPNGDEAWREIVRRYLRVYGPASREEFARWWGMQPAPAGGVLKAFGEGLVEVDVEGHRGWLLAEDLPAVRKARSLATLRLLPAFDVYMAGTRPRGSLVDGRFEDRVFRQAGWVSPVVLVDGRAAAVWSHERRNDRIEVTISPFRKLTPEDKSGIAEEAEGLGRFLGASAAVSYVG